MTKRTSLSKRLRFEIFKRDGFRCIYCGATPLQATLHVDHVKPVAEGGTDDPENLVTACPDCNLGKSKVPLEQRKLKVPEGGAEAAKEHLEQIREYLEHQRAIADVKNEAAEELSRYWESTVGPISQDMFGRLKGLLSAWPHDKLIEGMDITGRKLGTVGDNYNAHRANEQARYFHGVLRRWREEQSEPTRPPVQPPPPAPPPASVHARRADSAIQREIARVKAAGEAEFPTYESKLRAIYAAFARAAWGSAEDLEWAAGDAFQYGGLEIRGLMLEAKETPNGTTSFRVSDLPSFDPYRQAYEELHQQVQLGLSPPGDPEAQRLRELAKLAELDTELYWWLALWIEEPGALDWLRKRSDSPLLKRWEFD